ncbi:unnamed protein product [Triticum turgidum subsp. durum]|uniref:PDZ domain-containing protein n=1 Tax=Triticum turgidum subsp. durum TaxID=4567 RepID=A0A9R1AFZ3_TRITD|nr:unnamed protein product [Triticum turgidum subsp. durum]
MVESKTGLVLTTARLIRTKDAPVSVWSGGEEYYELLQYDNGGPVIDLDGEVVGMVNDPKRFESFIPSSILLNCLDSWRKYRHFSRPHLGMTFKAIELLEPAHVDMLWRMFNIDDGLVVQEVSKGSNAEILGIQKGDVIESINGKRVSTTIEVGLLMS